ncbi:MAG: Eco57I restriction-modification methylase domain-containing protein [Rhodobacteraceae bacterium]|nr:Eco57I restriction-modification methylase domain-containing protein [Paracoccaceae bacterium]
MTPMSIAQFMAHLLPVPDKGPIRVLDPGAGIGSLSSAFLSRVLAAGRAAADCEVVAYELDEALHSELRQSLESFTDVTYEIIGGDFISHAVDELFLSRHHFTCAVLNPPYKKINSKSDQRGLLRSTGIETVNLYSGFVALALAMLKPGGHLVAIIPRSFCNGPYYRPFRDMMLSEAAIWHIHIFEKRNTAFNGDEVLQENVILHLEKHGTQGEVTVSSSMDASFSDLSSRLWPFSDLVRENNPERFIHIPVTGKASEIGLPSFATHPLDALGVGVSTGPVVDFRLKAHLRKESGEGSVPLLYPAHFVNYGTCWPKANFKKNNAIASNSETRKGLFPNGYYAIVRRFSAKEERRRVRANVLTPEDTAGAETIGFENHLNVFHCKKHSLEPAVAFGLVAYLNSTAVDTYFRSFNGHTQVNATDLRQLTYPNLATLKNLGEWLMGCSTCSQEAIDKKIRKLE